MKTEDQRGQDTGPRSHGKAEVQIWGWMTPERSAMAPSCSSTPVPWGLTPCPLLMVTAPQGEWGVFCSCVEA